MAYDLLYKAQIPLNCSRNPDQGPTVNTPTVALATAGLFVVLRGFFGRALLEGEKHHYQREFRPGHHPTIEMPAMPMGEMMRYEGNGY